MWFRQVPGLARLLAILFAGAQLAGSVPLSAGHRNSPRAAVVHVDHHHTHPSGHQHRHHDDSRRIIDFGEGCCALHALLTGTLPHETLIAKLITRGTRLVFDPVQRLNGVAPDPLDRPPRPVLQI